MPSDLSDRILLTGATGYVGGRLLSRLLQRNHTVNALVRNPEHLRVSHPRLYGCKGDVCAPETLGEAFKNVDTAYYLIHSMGTKASYAKQDREGARNFAEAARQAGVKRIIYLGGLAHADTEALSEHMESRHEVGRILSESGIPVIEFRASIVIGSGSLSFELIRALVERLPVMVTPRWVRIMAQPIGADDLLAYLLAALDLPQEQPSTVYEIGGADLISYGGLMREYARQRGLRRVMIPVPVLTPRLSSLWLGLVTPIYARIGRKLIASIKNASVVEDTRALTDFSIRPRGIREIIELALRNEDQDFAETRWSDALSSSSADTSWGGKRFGTRRVDSRHVDVDVSPDAAFRPIQCIGGKNGWYFAGILWRLRGWIDLLAGGVGMRRGRRHPEELCLGDSLDWWRVESIEPNTRLLLRAEMKVPGRAWLEFEVTPIENGSRIRQTAIFDPAGLFGTFYWFALYPIHAFIFSGMLRGIARRARPSAR